MTDGDSPKPGRLNRRGVRVHGELVRARRLHLGMTQEDLANAGGLTVRTVQACEAGRTVSADTARRLHVALGLPARALLLATPEQMRERLAACGCAPPPRPRVWASREPAESEVLRALDPRRPTPWLCLSGVSGIGKTSLARWAAAELAGAYDGGVVWLAMDGARLEAGPCTILVTLARALGFAESLPPEGVVAPFAWLSAWRHHFWARPRLLVLDDAVRADTVEILTGDVPRAGVLVTTSRRAVAESPLAVEVRLGPLPDASAMALLRQVLGDARVDDDLEGAGRLVEALGGNPRSLQVAAGFLARHRYVTAGSYADALRESASEPDASWLGALPEGEETLVAAVRQLSGRLPPGALQALGDLSALGEPEFPASWALAAVGGDPRAGRAALSQLVDAYLLEDMGADGLSSIGPFRLDGQCQRASLAAARQHGSAAAARLEAWAPREAARVAAMPWSEAVREVQGTLGLWGRLFERLVQAAVDDPDAAARMDHPGRAVGGPASEGAAGVLVGLLASLGRMLVHLAPSSAQRWLAVGFVATDAAPHVGSAGDMAQLLGHARAQQLDFAAARVWHREAVERLEADGRARAAGLAAVDLARMAFTSLDAETSLSELGLARDLLGQDGRSRAAEAAATVALAATLVHVQDDQDGWSSSAGLLQAALDAASEAEPTPFARAVAATARVNLALARHLAGHPVSMEGLSEAFCDVADLTRGDALDAIRLRGLADMLGLPVGRADAVLGEALALDAALLTCPDEMLGRRVVRLSELLTALCEARMGPLPGARGRLIARGTTVTDVLYARPFMADDIGLALICPLGPIAEAWDASAHRSCAAFIQHRLGGMEPLAALLGQLGRASGLDG